MIKKRIRPESVIVLCTLESKSEGGIRILGFAEKIDSIFEEKLTPKNIFNHFPVIGRSGGDDRWLGIINHIIIDTTSRFPRLTILEHLWHPYNLKLCGKRSILT